MKTYSKWETVILLLGDVAVFQVALWLSLVARYMTVPDTELIYLHVLPFSLLYVAWIFVFLVAGLYEKHTTAVKNKLGSILLRAQAGNAVIAVLFFYLIPYFEITPKTILFIYLVLSSVFLVVWRLYIVPRLGYGKRQKTLLVGSGVVLQEVQNEFKNSRYGYTVCATVDVNAVSPQDVLNRIEKEVRMQKPSIVMIDLKDPRIRPHMEQLYQSILSGVTFVPINRVYENVFDRIPVDSIGYTWILENITAASPLTYDTVSRIADLITATFLWVLSWPVYPIVYLAIKLDDKGPLFIRQERIGQGGRIITVTKFRTMSFDDGGKYGEGVANKVTRVGAFLRSSRVDELPQLMDVIRGHLSLVGPRPELPELVKEYRAEVPYYDLRHITKPGLSGWAQLYHENHPHHGVDVEETQNKLSYDLFYIKNRSVLLDVKIALKTIKTLLSRSGK